MAIEGMLGKEAVRQLILRALMEPQFRIQLQINPRGALGIQTLTAGDQQRIQQLLVAVNRLELDIRRVSDAVSCTI